MQRPWGRRELGWLESLKQFKWVEKFAFGASPKSGQPVFLSLSPASLLIPHCPPGTLCQGSLIQGHPFWGSTQACPSLYPPFRGLSLPSKPPFPLQESSYFLPYFLLRGGEREGEKERTCLSLVAFKQQAKNSGQEEGPGHHLPHSSLLASSLRNLWALSGRCLGCRLGSVGGPATPFLPVSHRGAPGFVGGLGHPPDELTSKGRRRGSVAQWEEPSFGTRQLWGWEARLNPSLLHNLEAALSFLSLSRLICKKGVR